MDTLHDYPTLNGAASNNQFAFFQSGNRMFRQREKVIQHDGLRVFNLSDEFFFMLSLQCGNVSQIPQYVPFLIQRFLDEIGDDNFSAVGHEIHFLI